MQTSTPGLFDCARTRMRLTPRGCGRMFMKAASYDPPPPVWDGLHHCLHCPIGARNAGQVVPNEAAAAADRLQSVCSRCTRMAARLVGKRLCVSCYNRERELRVGANGKGSRPVKLANAMRSEIIAVIDVNAGEARRVTQSVASATEAMFTIARQTTVPLGFGWSRHASNGG